MRVAIIGSRDIIDFSLLQKVVEESGFQITEIVSGGAKGVDSLAEKYARDKNIPIKIFPAHWQDFSEPCFIKINRFGKKYNALAGMKRNSDIIKYADAVIAIWKDKSKGTADSIKKARELNKILFIMEL